MTIRTRFAPSPTGFLHIGNVRTALLNYLFAKKNNGKFLLRIEDTDIARSTQAAIDVIYDGLKWLNIQYNDKAILQSDNIERHKQAVQTLLDNNRAYKCYASSDVIEDLREEAQKTGQKITYPDRDNTHNNYPSDAPYVVRLKTPMTGKTILHDMVQGDVKIDHNQIDDFILLRSDGTPTYMLAVVVDDIDMKISHIIRGDDHLINAFRQSILYQSLGADLPNFAHLPLIHAPDGSKLSKRHGALSITDWRDMGYLSDMMCDYLMRLGWSAGDRETLSLAEAVPLFDLEKISKSPARLDHDYMNHLNGHYIRQIPTDLLMQTLNDYKIVKNKTPYAPEIMIKIISVMDLFVKRIVNLNDLDHDLAFFAYAPDDYDEKAAALLKEPNNIFILKQFLPILENISNWENDILLADIKQFLKDNALKMPQLGPVLRSVFAGRASTPDLVPVVIALGQDTLVKRLKDFLSLRA